MKKLIAMTMALGFCLGFIKVTEAAQLTVTIKPAASYSVTIDTDDASLNLGTVQMGASTQTVIPATITITSTYLATDLQIEGEIAAGWTFDTSSDSLNTDEIAVWAVFTDTNTSVAPTQTGSYFNGTGLVSGSDMVGDAARYVGSEGGNSDLYEALGEAGLKDMDAMNPNEKAHLWLWFRLPDISTADTNHYISIIVSAGTPQS